MSIEKGLPLDWKERIKDKKVILYITSVTSLLNGGMKHIEKIEYVIETFRQQSEVVLWWRPHPLEISTLESMRPELLERYKEVREKYEKEEWRILDTSSDLHRAIVISDAYYGDFSSVIQLYEKTGKPILLASDSVNNKKEIQVMDFIIHENKLWFLGWNINCLFNMDLECTKLDIVGEIPSYRVVSSGLNNQIVKKGNYLVFIPANANTIERYELSSQEFSYIEIENSKISKFIGSAIIGEYCYCLPALENKIIKYNILKNKIEKEILIDIKENKLKCRRKVFVTERFFYFVYEESNVIGKYDVSNDTIKEYEIGNKEDYIYFVGKYENYIWIINSNKLSFVNEKTLDIVETIEFPRNFKSGEYAFCDYVNEDENIYLLPYSSNMILEINLRTKKINVLFEFKNEKMPQIISGKLINNTIYMIKNYNKICRFYLNEKKYIEQNIFLSDSQISEIETKMKQEKNSQRLFIGALLQEENAFRLTHILKDVFQSEDYKRDSRQIIGEKIHKLICV